MIKVPDDEIIETFTIISEHVETDSEFYTIEETLKIMQVNPYVWGFDEKLNHSMEKYWPDVK